MRVRLLHRERDPDFDAPLPSSAEAVVQDLELGVLLDAMARGDELLYDVSRQVLLMGLASPAEILYRQEVLRDCLRYPEAVRALYELAVEGADTKAKSMLFWARRSPEALLSRSLGALTLLLDVLERLRAQARENAGRFRSEGFTQLFAVLESELDEGYVREVEEELRELRFGSGTLISARLGLGNVGTDYELRRPLRRRLLERVRPAGGRRSYSFTVPPRDEHGLAVLSEIRARGLNRAADAVVQSLDHILGFFALLRAELGFYVACLNLSERLAEEGVATAFPVPCPVEEGSLSAEGLVDAPLALHLGRSVVGNDLAADGARLLVITGANQGGKSTFLRSLGVAQLMMQAGTFVTAAAFRASVCDGVFTHFRREEDETMTHGKLDEELVRMSELVDALRPGSLLVCNESFSSTNEREGSEIAREVVRALLEGGVRVYYVTHLFELASALLRQPPGPALFLRAERMPDGRRTYRVVPGEPLPTSHGRDSFQQVFGTALPAQGA